MQPIPLYFARHREVVTVGGQEYDFTITGSSTVSQADAERDAPDRFEALVAGGEALGRPAQPAVRRGPTLGARPSDPSPPSEDEAEALRAIQAAAARHPGVGARVYRTENGLRVLVTGTQAGPSSDRARALMEEMRTDALYVVLCRVHDTYRARLTPKPWRVGMADNYPQAADPPAWVREYDQASRGSPRCARWMRSGRSRRPRRGALPAGGVSAARRTKGPGGLRGRS